MALTAEHIERYIANHGPYLYHGCFSRSGMDPREMVECILREGIRPDMRGEAGPMPTPPWGDGEEEAGNSEHEDWWMDGHANWWLHPRPGHVFLTRCPEQAYGPPVIRVDIRNLDPSLIKADEDFIRDHGISFTDFPHRANDPRLREIGTISEGVRGSYWMPANDVSLGEQAEAINWGEHPLEAEASLIDWEGHCAYEGAIAPEVIEVHKGPRLDPRSPAEFDDLAKPELRDELPASPSAPLNPEISR